MAEVSPGGEVRLPHLALFWSRDNRHLTRLNAGMSDGGGGFVSKEEKEELFGPIPLECVRFVESDLLSHLFSLLRKGSSQRLDIRRQCNLIGGYGRAAGERRRERR